MCAKEGSAQAICPCHHTDKLRIKLARLTQSQYTAFGPHGSSTEPTAPGVDTSGRLGDPRIFPTGDHLVGLVVKASASRAEGPGFESRLRRDFFGVESYQ